MRKMLNFALAALVAVLMAAPAFAQAVAYNGNLAMGLSDGDNTTGFPTNNALPICAGLGPVANPGTVGTLSGYLPINARGTGGAGVGATLTFNAVSPTNGGAQEKDNSTCNVAIPGFFNPRLRSRTQVGAAHFPGRKGPFPSSAAPISVITAFTQAPAPATPTATYMLSAGGGNPNAVTVNTWTTTPAAGASSMTFMGSAFSASAPFLGAGQAAVRIQPGAARFGGGVPFSGGGGVQLGINFATTFGGLKLVPGDYGLVSYANGFLPTDPQLFGTDAKGHHIAAQVTTSVFTPSFMNPVGLINGRQNNTYAGRTPGGSTQFLSGAVLTVNNNTATPTGTFMAPIGPSTFITLDCVTGLPAPCPEIVSDVAFTGYFNEWSTGVGTWTDMVGDFYTIRKRTGFDVAVASTTAVGGETRRLQLVSPWGATIKAVGIFGLPVPTLGFGGSAVLELNVIPIPEPGSIAMLGFGVAGLIGLRSVRRRS